MTAAGSAGERSCRVALGASPTVAQLAEWGRLWVDLCAALSADTAPAACSAPVH